MSYNEKKMQSEFTAWMRDQKKKGKFNFSMVFELKVCHQKRFAFSKIEEHQITSLNKANQSCLFHKISDQGMGFKPFDGFQICNVPAYLIILFYEPRKPKELIWIPIQHLNYLKQDNSTIKSITEEEAKQIGQTHLMYAL